MANWKEIRELVKDEFPFNKLNILELDEIRITSKDVQGKVRNFLFSNREWNYLSEKEIAKKIISKL